jgi:hypothetical protein
MLEIEELARLVEQERQRGRLHRAGDAVARRGGSARHNLRSLMRWLGAARARNG